MQVRESHRSLIVGLKESGICGDSDGIELDRGVQITLLVSVLTRFKSRGWILLNVPGARRLRRSDRFDRKNQNN
jgi:hypothetical protein